MGAHGDYWFSKATAVTPLALIIILLFTASAGGVKHIVGGSVWSIPPSVHFYNNWSTSQTFVPGDVLYFDFESEMYNVHQVLSDEYNHCESTLSPVNAYEEGPALVTLPYTGEYMFLCSMLNYCSQGMKIMIFVRMPSASTPPVRVLP
ncbi:unnamed protein product [Lactuca saligna]|uniref:Phytocyanin domain-containing protein n=1 Tax=Lactuca saligna TaxID=75948 RepID=A0AA35YFY1_LACSI|nr:unnamed protein product [Lactuca saligna]